jgi:hypothetical protein
LQSLQEIAGNLPPVVGPGPDIADRGYLLPELIAGFYEQHFI